jgi:glycosyltransferase involved in cell wall biosynthesis
VSGPPIAADVSGDGVRITVVIPTCDRPTLLHEAVACVAAQSETADEVIIVNNGSGAVDLGDRTSAVHVVDIMPYAGASQARNFGALLATGSHVAFLDDDDLWERDYLRKVRAIILRDDPDLIVARLDRWTDGTIHPYRDAAKVPDLYEAVLTTNPGVGGPNTVVRRATFLRVGGYDPELITSEDRSLFIEFARGGHKIVATSEVQAIAREHAGDRLTQPDRMAEGKRRFLRKYGALMGRAMLQRNLAIINYQRFRAGHGPWHLVLTGWHLGMSAISPRRRAAR